VTPDALAPKMAARGGGSIIYIGSEVGQTGMANTAAYSATKSAVASMTRSWAAEFSPVGVRVNTVAPGPVYTPVQSDAETDALGSGTPNVPRWSASEIAEVIAFLASPRASYITGAVIAADGGRTAT
jgi:NAD(P)-dependent dehydrogenase (short-subunit alcohol dehydrogenase family)